MARAFVLRDYREADAASFNRVALAAFEEYSAHFNDWPTLARGIAQTSDLSQTGEIIIAERDGVVTGGVVYIPSDQPKAEFFDPSWTIIRMLVVDPTARGLGLGRALSEECIRRAKRDTAKIIALHTSDMMTVALPMYERMGFKRLCDAPPIFGVPYGVYTMAL